MQLRMMWGVDRESRYVGRATACPRTLNRRDRGGYAHACWTCCAAHAHVGTCVDRIEQSQGDYRALHML